MADVDIIAKSLTGLTGADAVRPMRLNHSEVSGAIVWHFSAGDRFYPAITSISSTLLNSVTSVEASLANVQIFSLRTE